MAAIIECPACFTMLKEHGDEMKVHKNTYNVFDIHSGENTGSVDDDFIRIITCNYCGYAGASDTFPD